MTSLHSRGYRNLDGEVPLCHPLAVLVGENNAGKSNVIDALRTVLSPELGPRHRQWLGEDDFAHDGRGEPVSEEIELELRLGGLSEAERAQMVTCLAPGDGPDRARLRLRARRGLIGRVDVQWYGGESAHPDVEAHARNAVRFVYLHPLRDAAADLRPGRDNRLIALMAALAPEGHPDRDQLVDTAIAANDAFSGIDVVQHAKDSIASRIGAMTGAARFGQHTDLAFADPRFERIIGALRAQVGQLAAREMAENGLGFNNLLYMAVVLAALANPPDAALRVLLVEEPEAHLHPQLQDLLMRFLEAEAGENTQVVVTTHSPNFAASARVERLTVLARPDAEAPKPAARAPRDFGLSRRQLDHLRRFLDATKSGLFFARAVILVEGVAEQLLLPVIAAQLGRPLAPSGVAVVNIGGVAFPPFADLFGNGKLPYRLAVVSDGDSEPPEDEVEGADELLSPRAASLLGREGDNVRVSLARRTFEWDLYIAGNGSAMLDALADVKPRVAERLRAEQLGQNAEDAANALLKAVQDVKGRYAQAFADRLEATAGSIVVPRYLQHAVEWVADEVKTS